MRSAFLVIFLTSFFPAFCVEKSSSIVIENNGDFKFFGFFYGNDFNDLESSIKLRQKDSIGNYLNRFVINTEVPVLVIFTKGVFMEGSPVLLYPGDTCKVYNNGDGGFDFRSNNHGNGDLKILDKMEKELGFVTPENLGLTISSRLDIMYIVDRIRATYLNRKLFIEDYGKAHPISDEYRTTSEKLIYQKYIISLLFPFYLPQDFAGYNFESLPAEYYTVLSNGMEGVLDDSQIHLNSYQLMLLNYCRYLSKSSLNTSEEFVAMFDNARQHFSGKSREFLMFLILKKYTGKGLPEYKRNAEMFLSEYPVLEYREYLIRLIPNDLTKNMITLSSEKLVSHSDTEMTWKEIIETRKGKVIYIDFWASWCGPCLQEMPHSATLRDSLKARDVTFLYISLDQNHDSWIRAANKLKFDASQHFLFKEESSLKTLFALQAIPKYIIIDKKGNIFSPDAPRPSDSRLYDTLLRLSTE